MAVLKQRNVDRWVEAQKRMSSSKLVNMVNKSNTYRAQKLLKSVWRLPKAISS